MGDARDQKASETRTFPQVERILLAARQSGQKGNLREAEALYVEARQQSQDLHYAEGEARALAGMGACELGTFEYRQSLHSLLSARDLAARVGNPFLSGTIAGNLASLYIYLNSLPEAAEEIDHSIYYLSLARGKSASQTLLGAYLVKADILYHQGKPVEGKYSAQKAIALAESIGDKRSEAFGWKKLAEYVLFEQYDAPRSLYEEADGYLKNASKIEAETHEQDDAFFETQVDQAYVTLCLGRPKLALEVMEGAMTSASALNLSKSYEVLQTKGLILAQLGRTDEALGSLRSAVQRADEWRSAALPGDVSSTATVALLHSVYSDYITRAAATALARNNQALMRDSLEVLARSRAANLREQALFYLQRLDRLPPEYYDLLRQLEAAQAKSLAEPGGPDELAARQIRARLSVLQDQVGLSANEFSKDRERNFHQKSLRDIQQSLGAEDLLLSFSLGKKMADTSYMWATTGDSVNLYSIGTRQAIEEAAEQFKMAVRSRTVSDASRCHLADMLFSNLPPQLRAKKHWLLVPDGQLLNGIPWAALPDTGQPRSAYLISRRDVRTLPSELFLGIRKQKLADNFVGIGDPIYNRADSRLSSGQKRIGKPAQPLVLARLAGSETELENASRAWNSETSALLTAEHATVADLQIAIEHQAPGILHFAVHVLSPEDHPEQAALALSLTPRGLPELLTPEIISTLQLPGTVVVLSGCASQRGRVLPGAGLIGLSRAWLLAGASAVIVSAWPTPDDSARFFEAFYASLKTHDIATHSVVERTAAALRDAQLEMQRDPGYRRSPDYWAAYTVISKE